MIYVAKYILTEEYVCRCCHSLPPSFNSDKPDAPFEILFDSFALIRERWGAPINITSGYRCPRHNSFVSGHPLSVHQFGLALDIKVEPHDIERLYSIVEHEVPNLRVGKYETWLHIDVGYLIYPKASYSWKKGVRWNET